MKITYDPEVDVMRIIFSSTPIEESDEEKPGDQIPHSGVTERKHPVVGG